MYNALRARPRVDITARFCKSLDNSFFFFEGGDRFSRIRHVAVNIATRYRE